MKFKKILIISGWAPPKLGGAQMMYNLFSQFPDDSYCILTSFYNIDNYSAKNGTWLGGKYIFFDNLGFEGGGLKYRVSENSAGRNKANWLKKTKLIKTISTPFLLLLETIMMVKEGLKASKNEKIDVLLGISDYGGAALISTYLLHILTKRPYLLYLFDLYKDNYNPFPGGILAKIFEGPLIRNSEKIIVTNDATKEFYIKRYQWQTSKFEVIYNSTFSDEYLKLRTPHNLKEPFSIIFTGTIGWAQLESIKNLIRAVSEIHKYKIRLKFYVPQEQDYIKALGLDLHGIEFSSAPSNQMPEVQTKADILFLPLSWHAKSPQIIETATPGKLSDYLISGRPILVHAPEWSALAKYARKNNFALVVDKNDINLLRESILELIKNKRLGQIITENATKVFFKNHDAKINVKKFQNLFRSNIHPYLTHNE